MKAILHTDGGARGNPGPAGIGAVLSDATGAELAHVAESIGVATNNEAEYRALIAGLELALANHVTDLEAFVDSELVASQMRGEWKIKKETLRQLALRASGLAARFERFELVHVRRGSNARADELANEAMDRAAIEVDEDGPGQTTLLG